MKNVSKKLLAAIASVGGKVQKTGYNKFSSYSYITESDINEAILPALLEQNLLLTTSVESAVEIPCDGSSKNRFATVQLLHKIIDTDSGEFIEFKSAGTGADTLDKAVYKAYTGACKYFLMKTFLISGDDSDPENDGNVKPKVETEKKGFSLKKSPPKEETVRKPSFGTRKPTIKVETEESEEDAAY